MKTLGAWLLIFFGLFMLLGFFASEKEFSIVADTLQLLLLVFTPIAVGIRLLVSQSRARARSAEQQKQLLQATREKEVLMLARNKLGKLTVTDVVTETSMTSIEAEAVLHELIIKGLVDMKMSNAGQVTYEFAGADRPSELLEMEIQAKELSKNKE